MDKYINAEHLIEKFNSIHPDSQLMYATAFAEFVKDVPAADVAPVVHARWILVKRLADGGICECSNCREQSCFNSFNRHTSYKFCYQCGAKMDLEESEL